MAAELREYWSDRHEAAAKPNDTNDCTKSQFELGAAFHWAGDFKSAIKQLTEIYSCGINDTDKTLRIPTIYYLGRSYLSLGQFAEAGALLRQGLELAENKQDKQFICFFHFGLAKLHRQAQAVDQAIEELELTTRYCRDYGLQALEMEANYMLYQVLRERYLYNEARKIIDRCIKLSRQLKYRTNECLYHYLKGFILSDLQRHRTAIDSLKTSVVLARQTGRHDLEGHALIRIGASFMSLGKNEEAEPFLLESARCFEENNDSDGKVSVYGALADYYAVVSNNPKRMKYINLLIEIANEESDNSAALDALNEISSIYIDLGESQNTITYAERGLEIAKATGNERMKYLLSIIAGDTWQIRGDYKKAQHYYELALGAVGIEDDHLHRTRLYNSVGSLYLLLKNQAEASRYFNLALRACKETGNPMLEGLTLLNISLLDIKDGNYKKASRSLDKCLAITRLINDQLFTNLTFYHMAYLYMEINDLEKALSSFSDCLEVSKRSFNTHGQYLAYVGMGEVFTRQGNDRLAIQSTQKAIKFAAKFDYLSGIASQETALSVNYANLGKPRFALKHAASAFASVEALRDKLEYESQKSSFAGGYSIVYDSYVRLLNQFNMSERAYYVSECNRARTHYERILQRSTIQTSAPSYKVLPWASIDRALQDWNAKPKPNSGRYEAVGNAANRHFRRQPVKQGNAPQGESPKEVVIGASFLPLEVDRIQEHLELNSSLLQFHVLDDRVLIWCITKRQITSKAIEITTADLQTEINGFSETIMFKGVSGGSAHRFYSQLIEPVESALSSGKLIIVPHRCLHYLPFEALLDRKGVALGDKYNISYLPSGSLIKHLRERKVRMPNRLLAVGNPTLRYGSLRQLPLSEVEVNSIGKYFSESEIIIGDPATKDAFTRLSSNCDVIHLACHAVLNGEKPTESGLYFATSDEVDGLMTIPEIYELELNAELIVLSCCETALGAMNEGDELIGVSRAFMFAGASSVIASLWEVEDESTAYFMQQFYTNWKSNSKSEALRLARIATREKYPKTFHWAPFILIGDGR